MKADIAHGMVLTASEDAAVCMDMMSKVLAMGV